MKIAQTLACLSAAMLFAAPAIASAATDEARHSSPIVESEELVGSSGMSTLIGFAAALVAIIIIASDDDDAPASP